MPQHNQRRWPLAWNTITALSLVLILSSVGYSRQISRDRRPIVASQPLKAEVWQPTTPPGLPSKPTSVIGAPTRGSATARVVMILFSDFECPFSGRFATQVLPDVERDFVARGQVLLVFRHLPLQTLHPEAMAAAEAAECARDQGAFWEMHDDLFMNSRQLDSLALEYRAELSGLDHERFQRCLVSHSAQTRILTDIAEAERLGVNSTPTVLLGRRDSLGSVQIERRFDSSVPFGTLSGAVEALLNPRDDKLK